MTKFNISKVEIQNFRSIQSQVALEIKPGLYCIQGINHDETPSSNGAGKSTLISAVYWCLTGNALTNEVLADEVINNSVGKNCRVTLYISTEKDDIKITRTRKDSEYGNNLLLEINGQDISCHKTADTQIRINQLIKIPHELLHSTIMMTHDIKSAFSELTPQQRIQILESIRDYSIWDKVRDEANKDIKEYNKQIQDIKLNNSNLEGKLSTYNSMLSKENDNLNILKAQNIDELKSKITHFSNEKEQINTHFSDESKKLLELNSKIYQDNSALQQELTNIVNEANELKIKKQKIEFDKQNLQKEVDLINKWFKDDKCPTCGKPLDRNKDTIDTKNMMKNGFIKSIEEFESNIKQIDNEIILKRKEWSNKNTLFQNLEKTKNEDNEIKKVINNNIITYNNKINELETQINKLQSEYDSHNNQIEKSIKIIEEYKLEIDKLEKTIKENTSSIKSLEIKRQISDYFYKLLGSKGELRPYLLYQDIEYINSCMQKYIHEFFKNTEVTLKLNGASIDIDIDSLGIKKNVSSLSGGEKKRLNIAIQLALYDLIKMTSQIEFNILWLDELESEMDSLGCQQLINIIEDKSDIIETLFWITNSNMVMENIPNKIICEKKCGKTEVYEV